MRRACSRFSGKVIAVAIGLVVAAGSARAQPAAMVADIQASEATLFPLPWPGGWQRTNFIAVNGVVVMALDDSVHGNELWVSDGTPSGSHLLRDLCPGSCSGEPIGFTSFGGVVYFAADDGAHGVELWRTDGTDAGTVLFADLVSGLGGSEPWSFAAAGELLYFAARLPDGEIPLWRSDGTLAGTWPLTAGSVDDGIPRRPVVLGHVGNRVVFGFGDAAHGIEPWATDGTVAGTALLVDVYPGPTDSWYLDQAFRGVSSPVQVNGHVVFLADDGIHGAEPWVSDGTAAGTGLLLDVQPGVASSKPARLTLAGSRACFLASDPVGGYELWTTDGTSAGTRRLTDLEGSPWYVSGLGSILLFNSATANSGNELWRSDGTPEGTVLVKDLWPGPESGVSAWRTGGWFTLGDKAFFMADDGVHGVEPWITDGTEAGTQMLVNASVNGPDPGGLTLAYYYYGLLDAPAAVGARLIFRLVRDFRSNELWVTDGTPAGTERLVVVGTGGSSVAEQIRREPWFEQRLGAAGGSVVFAADDGMTGSELWRSDGTPDGTHLAVDFAPGSLGGAPAASYPDSFLALGGRSLFNYQAPDPETGQYLAWLGVSDGTLAGSGALVPGGWIESSAVVGSEVVLSAEGVLVRSDGTTLGTQQVPCACSRAYDLGAVAGRVMFAADGASGSGREPWVFDPLTGATELLADLAPGPGDSNPDFIGAGPSWALFTVDVPPAGRALWRTDGTAAGTSLLGQLDAAEWSAGDPRTQHGVRSARLESELAFAASDGVAGEELWRSDGTVAGTMQVADLRPGPLSSQPRWLTARGPRVVFSADDGVHGRELWASDGTEEGTVLLRDLWPGPESGVPQRLLAVDDVVLFAASDGVHGLELWRTDGTPLGTLMIQDLAPGPAAGGPLALTRAGNGVFFLATDGQHGFEPWRLSLEALERLELFADGLESGTTGRWSLVP